MKKIICTSLLALAFNTWIASQETIPYITLGQTVVSQQDSTLAVLSITYPINFLLLQDSFLVTTNPVFFPLFTQEDTTTFLPDLDWIEGIHLFPNPTYGSLTLVKEDVPFALHVELFDANGILVNAYDWPEFINTLHPSLQAYPPGTYFLTVTNGEKSMRSTYKIVRE